MWVAPSAFRRVLAAQGLVLPETPARARPARRPWPDWLEWVPNRIWIYDATHFGAARRVVFAIVDMVSRKWIDTLVSVEETSTQVQVCQRSVGSPRWWPWGFPVDGHEDSPRTAGVFPGLMGGG
ncbi:MAG: hypothetical protein KJ056_04635 [Acidimicrobiia bacterium]|nr:hypothetical protein [Acidimicrobiia bacterium]